MNHFSNIPGIPYEGAEAIFDTVYADIYKGSRFYGTVELVRGDIKIDYVIDPAEFSDLELDCKVKVVSFGDSGQGDYLLQVEDTE